MTHHRGRRLLFLLPAIAVTTSVLAVGPSSARAATRPATVLPLTFDEARAQGKQVDWGPGCDTSTGKLAVPSGYAPPCVEPWTGGSNGGATAPGVTKDTITVVLYQAQPDLLQQAFFENSGSDESLAKERDTTQQYIDYFSADYELYGRMVKMVTLKASGAPDDDIAAKADAIKAATELHAFASFGGPGQTTAYAEELAARGVLCVGDCVIAEPQSFLEQNAPFVWPTIASPEQASEHWAAFVGTQLAGGAAEHAGDPALASKTRVFGIVHYDDDAGTFAESVAHFKQRLAHYHVKPAVTVRLRARPHDRAAERPQCDREAEELRCHERDPRRRPGVPDVPDPGGNGAGVFPGMGRARICLHRHRGLRTAVRPEAVVARLRRLAAPGAHHRERRRAGEHHHVADRPSSDRVDLP